MSVGIDGKPLTLTFPCGLREYAWQLVTHLAKIDHKNTYLIFSPVQIKLPRQKNFILRVGTPAIPWQMQLPFLVYREKIDVFHFLQQHGSIFFVILK
ncbi:MAG: hypothetical protein ACOY0S_01060 [Patescibacteria group bacterium]